MIYFYWNDTFIDDKKKKENVNKFIVNFKGNNYKNNYIYSIWKYDIF
jgi:hypothetical protein